MPEPPYIPTDPNNPDFGGIPPYQGATVPFPDHSEKQHVHHSYIWLGSFRLVLALLFAAFLAIFSSLANIFFSDDPPDPQADEVMGLVVGTAVTALIVVAVIIIVYQVVSYRYLYYQFLPGEFNLYQGIINKKQVHIPYQRVQSVDQRASLLQRLFGVCTVSIDTAGGANNKAVTIPYLTKSQAEQLRAQLFARKAYVTTGTLDPQSITRQPDFPQAYPGASAPHLPANQGNILDAPAGIWDEIGGVFAGQAVDTGVISYQYGLTNKELVLTGISNNTAFLLVIVSVVATLLEVASNVFTIVPQTGLVVAGTLGNAAHNGQVFNIIGWGIGALIALALVVWIISAVVTCINYGGFHARRRNSRIEVERGLLQHRFMGVDIDRVQSVVIRQSLIRRLLGYCELSLGKIDAAQSDDSSDNNGLAEQGLVIHPFVKVDRVPDILRGLVPEYSDLPLPTETHHVAPVALRRGLIRRCIWQGSGFWLAVIIAATQLIMHGIYAGYGGMGTDGPTAMAILDTVALAGYIFAVLLLVLDIIGAILWFRESSFGYNRRFMQMSIGGLSRETTSFLRQKIQFGYTKTNPLQRLAKTASIYARTAAGIGGTTMRLIDVADEDAQTWLDWLQPRGNVLQ